MNESRKSERVFMMVSNVDLVYKCIQQMLIHHNDLIVSYSASLVMLFML